MKTILVPVDFSKNSDNACKYAISLAKVSKAKIILMHAYETPVMLADSSMMALPVDFTLFSKKAAKDLTTYHKKISPLAGNIKIEVILQEGLPSSRIKEIALEKKADLIVIGTTGRGAIERILVGSNAARIINDAPCLVLAVPPKAKFTELKKIVYATDLSEDNLMHAKAVVPLAKLFKSEILFLYIHTHILQGIDEKIKAALKKINKAIAYPKTSGYFCSDLDINNGINYFMKLNKADCLAMFTRHRSLLGRIFKPGITKGAVFHASVPLLVIHENDIF